MPFVDLWRNRRDVFATGGHRYTIAGMAHFIVGPPRGAVLVGEGNLEFQAPAQAVAEIEAKRDTAGSHASNEAEAIAMNAIGASHELAAQVKAMKDVKVLYSVGQPSQGGNFTWRFHTKVYVFDAALLPQKRK